MTITVDTIKQERLALLELLRDVPGIQSFYAHEPKQIGQTPAVTIFFSGIAEPDPANLRTSKQFRQYQVRVYVAGLEDMALAQDLVGEMVIKVWDALTAAKRLDDTTNVILVTVGETSVSFVTGEEGKPFIVGTINLTTQHRSPY